MIGADPRWAPGAQPCASKAHQTTLVVSPTVSRCASVDNPCDHSSYISPRAWCRRLRLPRKRRRGKEGTSRRAARAMSMASLTPPRPGVFGGVGAKHCTKPPAQRHRVSVALASAPRSFDGRLGGVSRAKGAAKAALMPRDVSLGVRGRRRCVVVRAHGEHGEEESGDPSRQTGDPSDPHRKILSSQTVVPLGCPSTCPYPFLGGLVPNPNESSLFPKERGARRQCRREWVRRDDRRRSI